MPRQGFGRWMQQGRRLLGVAALALLSAGWSNPLRPLTEGMDSRVLKEDSQYMLELYTQREQAGARGEVMPIDLADERQYRFVMNRLKAAGKTPRNAPHLFQRLAEVRLRAVKRAASPAASVEAGIWGCEHDATLVPLAATSTQRAYKAGATGTCQGGANYMYLDVLVYDSDLQGGSREAVDSDSAEEYAGGTRFSVTTTAMLPLSAVRQPEVESMLIAMNDETGEDYVVFLRQPGGSTLDPARVTVTHPSFATAGSRQNIMTCQLCGESECDYALVQPVDGKLVPWTSSPTGMAQWLGGTPWRGNPDAFFPLAPGTHDFNKNYLPSRFTFDAGAGTQACVIRSFNPLTRVRVLKALQGGQCGTEESLAGMLTPGARVSSLSRLLSTPRNTTVTATPGAECGMARLTQELMTYSLTLSAQADCGQGEETRFVTFHSASEAGWKVYVQNGCIAADTGVERADGTFVPVEALRAGDRVVANDRGLVLTVTRVQPGLKAPSLYHLKDDQGHEVRLTPEHPVVLASGKVVRADAVKVKDRVRTRQGRASIVSIRPVPYDGQVYNLALGTPEELAKVTKEERTLFAGGFQVGDSSLQLEPEVPRQASADVLRKLSKPWQQDFKKRPVLQ